MVPLAVFGELDSDEAVPTAVTGWAEFELAAVGAFAVQNNAVLVGVATVVAVVAAAVAAAGTRVVLRATTCLGVRPSVLCVAVGARAMLFRVHC